MVDYSKWDKLDISDDEDDVSENFQQQKDPSTEQFQLETFPIPPEHRTASFVDTDLADYLDMICRIVRQENPATWKPPWPNPDEWGVQENDILDKIDDMEQRRQWVMAREARRMNNQMLYQGRDTPELQFVKRMAERKAAELEAAQGEAKLRYKRDYVLEIYMHELEPPIWRRFKVSGGIVLNTFADEVVIPIMGWVRNFHGYVFTDRRDGSIFGPKGSDAIDICCHLSRSWYYYMDDKQYKLADLLTEKGARLGWLYDVGDCWLHEIEVEEIKSEAESTGVCEVLEGTGRCPPENLRGNFLYQETIEILKNKKHKEYWKLLDECNAQLNVKPKLFDFREFNLKERQRALKQALASTGSTQTGSKAFKVDLRPGEPQSKAFDNKKPGKGQKRVESSDGFFEPILTETVSTRADKVEVSLCADRGRPEALFRCAKCKVLRYCSRECQVRHWKESHKRQCSLKKCAA